MLIIKCIRLWLLVSSLVDVVCIAPQVPDPFQTLADIYEARGDADKRMQACSFCTCCLYQLVLQQIFHTMSLILHINGALITVTWRLVIDMNKWLCRFQCQLIVAHLKQTDAEDWYALGQEFQEMNNIEQALFCYDRGGCNLYYLHKFSAMCSFALRQSAPSVLVSSLQLLVLLDKNSDNLKPN